MRLVQWTDDNGYKHLSSILDNDPDTEAPNGLPNDPPDLGRLNWDEIQRELHNRLVESRITQYEDLMGGAGTSLQSIIISTFKPKLIHLLKTVDKED